MWLKYGFKGIIWYLIMTTATIVTNYFLLEHTVTLPILIKSYLAAVIIGFFFGITLFYTKKKYPKDVTKTTWLRFAFYFLIYVGLAVTVYSSLYIKFIYPYNMGILRYTLIFLSFFPACAFLIGVILFFVKKRKMSQVYEE